MNVLLKGKKQCKVNSSPFEERNKSTGNWQLQIDPIKTKEQISHSMLMVMVFLSPIRKSNIVAMGNSLQIVVLNGQSYRNDGFTIPMFDSLRP